MARCTHKLLCYLKASFQGAVCAPSPRESLREASQDTHSHIRHQKQSNASDEQKFYGRNQTASIQRNVLSNLQIGFHQDYFPLGLFFFFSHKTPKSFSSTICLNKTDKLFVLQHSDIKTLNSSQKRLIVSRHCRILFSCKIKTRR